MAPGTRLNQEKIELKSDDDMSFVATNDDAAQNEPWPTVGEINETQNSFTDSFTEVTLNQTCKNNCFEQNPIYLQLLEKKLARIESKNKDVRKICAKEMITAIAEVKDEQAMNIMMENSTSESFDIEYNTADLTMTNELRRRMFPEQCANNQSELLHLIKHDLLQNNKNL